MNRVPEHLGFSLPEILVLASTAGAGKMAPPARVNVESGMHGGRIARRRNRATRNSSTPQAGKTPASESRQEYFVKSSQGSTEIADTHHHKQGLQCWCITYVSPLNVLNEENQSWCERFTSNPATHRGAE